MPHSLGPDSRGGSDELSKSPRKGTSHSDDSENHPQSGVTFGFKQAVERLEKLQKPRSKFSRAATLLARLHQQQDAKNDSQQHPSSDEEEGSGYHGALCPEKAKMSRLAQIQQPKLEVLCDLPEAEFDSAAMSNRQTRKKDGSDAKKPAADPIGNRRKARVSQTNLQLFGNQTGNSLMIQIKEKQKLGGSDEDSQDGKKGFGSVGSFDRAGGQFSLYSVGENKPVDAPVAPPTPELLAEQAERQKHTKPPEKRKLAGTQIFRIAPKIHI